MHTLYFENREAGQNLAGQRPLGKERCSFFPILSLRRLRLAVAGQILSIGIALLLLGLAVPDAGAQPFTERNPAPFTERNPAQDFNTLGLVGDNKNPVGLCAVRNPNDGKMYMLVSDSRDRKIYTYDIESKERQDNHRGTAANDDDFELTEVNLPTGIWASGTNLWVADGSVYGDKTSGRKFDPDNDTNKYAKVFAYTLLWERREETEGEGENARTNVYYLARKHERQKNKEFWLYHNGVNNESNISPTGLWSDGETMWVANSGRDRIFAYTLANGIRDATKEFDLGEGNDYAQGIWSDGETMWVSDFAGIETEHEKKIFAYKLELDDDEEEADRRDSSKDYNTLKGAGNERPRGIWSDGKTMWVADKIDNKIYAYHGFRISASRNPNEDFNTLRAAGNTNPRGLWSNRTNLWVSDFVRDMLLAYDLVSKRRNPAEDFLKETLISAGSTNNTGNTSPTVLWSDGVTMWVVDKHDKKVYAYKMEDKSHDSTKEIDLAAANANPAGLWSNGSTMWISDSIDKKLYGYNMWTNNVERNPVWDGSYDSEKDIDVGSLVVGVDDLSLGGLWSDGETMWVANHGDSKIYAVTLPQEGRAAARAASEDYDTLAAAENRTPTGLWSDGETMWVLDGGTNKIYAYNTLKVEARLGKLDVKGYIPNPPNPKYEDFDVDLNPAFNRGTTNYIASVPYATTRLAVSPRTLRPVIDTTATNFHHSLTVGTNTISIIVTNGHASSLPRTRTYKIEVTREFFTHNAPDKNIAVSADLTVQGLWANETNLWVSTAGTNKLYAYNKANRTRDVAKDIPLASANSDPRGIWSNGATMYVVDSGDDKVYAYGLISRTRLNSTNDFELNADNANPQWIWSDGATMWVTDNAGTLKNKDDDKIFAYKMSDKKPDSSREIDLGGLVKDNDAPSGIWSDGANLWVANSDTNNAKIYSYKLAGNRIDCREETKDFNTLEDVNNHDPKAIFSDGSIMYVADSVDGKIYAYNQPLSGNAWLKTLTLSGDVFYGAQPFELSNPTTDYGLWVDRSTIETTLIAEAQDPDAIGVDIVEPEEDANSSLNGYQVKLDAGNNTIRIKVTAENGHSNWYTVNIYRIINDERNPNLRFELARHEDEETDHSSIEPTGIWSDGATMWVVDGRDDKVYAYKMSGEEWGQLDTNKTFELSLDNTVSRDNSLTNAPGGIWSDGTTFWVSGGYGNANVGGRICAYPMWTTYTNSITNIVTDSAGRENEKTNQVTVDIFGERDPSQDFVNPSNLGFINPAGLWGDDETLWIANTHSTIFAYHLTGRTNVPSKDIVLSDSAVDIWADGTTMWVLNNLLGVDNNERKLKAYALDLDATEATNRVSRDTGKDIAIPNRGDPKAIWSNGTVMWVAFADSRNPDILAYPMPTPSAAPTGDSDFFFSEDSTLKDLQLSGATLTPAFSSTNLYYTALVDHTVHSATVTATPNDSMAAVDILSGGRGTTRSTARKGPQVSLEEGYNIIAIDVVAESRTAQSTYIIEVTKAEAPPVSGGPLPLFQSASVGDNPSASSSSAAGLGEWKSQLIFAEPLADGGVRFVFLVPPDELKMEETVDLLGGNWRPLPEDAFQATRESLGNGRDRLTVNLPKAAGKQRFLRLTPQR